jgi:hypothetical protein
LEQSVFFGSGLVSFTVPDGVTAIGGNAFENCTALESINILDGVTEIGSKAFQGCTALKSIVIPDSVTVAGFNTFRNCTNLADVTIGGGISKIDSYMFMDCPNLKSVEFPDNVAEIKSHAFAGCTALSSVTFGKGIEELYYGALKDCVNLKTVTFIKSKPPYIPRSINGDYPYAFENAGLEKVYVPEGASYAYEAIFPDYEVVRSGKKADLYEIEDGVLVSYNGGAEQNAVIPDAVTAIGAYAFRLSDPVSVVIPDSVKTIGEYAFYNCKNLTSVTIGGGVEKIERCAFRGTGLTSVSLPDSVTSMSYNVFESCKNLTTVKLSKNLTAIASCTFYNCESLIKIEIPDGVTVIGSEAFVGCRSLKTAVLPDSVTSIGVSSFLGCAALSEITLPAGLTDIKYAAFRACRSLTEIKIPGSVSEIGSGVFELCTGLTSVAIPESVTVIPVNMFKDCTSLAKVSLPRSLTEITNAAFSDCENLISVSFKGAQPPVVNNISWNKKGVFYNCSKLTDAYVPIGSESAYREFPPLEGIAITGVAFCEVCDEYPCECSPAYTFPTPDGYSNNDYQKLVAFFTQNENNTTIIADDLKWDLSAPETWNRSYIQVEWNKETPKSVTKIRIDREDEDDKLTGKLDVSDFLSLEYLNLEYNRLTEINVSNTPSLKGLSIDYNNITELDLSGCPMLEGLGCFETQLTSLSMLENKENLKIVDIRGNNIDLNDSVVQESITKIQAAIDKNGGLFAYTPQRAPTYSCPACGNSGVHCAACCKAESCQICNPSKPAESKPDFKVGYVLSNSKIQIGDAIEVFKYLAGMKNKIKDGGKDSNAMKAACITPASQKSGKPGISDALEILKKLAGMKNLIDNAN